MTTPVILDLAADAIREHGWWQSGGELDGMPLCAGNAIYKAADGCTREEMARATDAFVDYIGGASLGDIWTWNDAPGRTQEQVVAALRSCALLEAAREEAATQAPADRHEVAL